ncbi:hypothetical protein CLG_B1845 [Clostridium botulinum D str. 1873]|uniref:Uncharacterized protein n=1 Tax=Clostridium botulinum D str. 1873 TaxID=592027 RepID=A0A9P2G7H1_CLOBO|nr:hypothetical protein CLG_B1845 [Clostridium botulinum D str. 1873]
MNYYNKYLDVVNTFFKCFTCVYVLDREKKKFRYSLYKK